MVAHYLAGAIGHVPGVAGGVSRCGARRWPLILFDLSLAPIKGAVPMADASPSR